MSLKQPIDSMVMQGILRKQKIRVRSEIDELRKENARLREALETCATTLNQAGFRKQADIAYAALGEK